MSEGLNAWWPISLLGVIATTLVIPLIVVYSSFTSGTPRSGNPGKGEPHPTGNPGNPEAKIDAHFEPQREAKRREWQAAGYPEGLIERALTWAEEYSIGMAAKITDDPELRSRIEQSLYPRALGMSDHWIKGLIEFLE